MTTAAKNRKCFKVVTDSNKQHYLHGNDGSHPCKAVCFLHSKQCVTDSFYHSKQTGETIGKVSTTDDDSNSQQHQQMQWWWLGWV